MLTLRSVWDLLCTGETASSLNVGTITDSGTALRVIHYGRLMRSQVGQPLPEKGCVKVETYVCYVYL